MKKVREPMLTAEEKATKVNKQEIKGTGKIIILRLIFRFQLGYDSI